MLNNRKNNPLNPVGFTLIEMAVILTIIGLIISSALSAGVAQLEAKRILTTKKNLLLIQEAIEEYVQDNGHLPCPASPTLDSTNSNYGVGQGSNNRGGDGTPNQGACAGGIENSPSAGLRVFRGMAPFIDLDLNSETVRDGWGNLFTYVVDEDLTFVGDTWVSGGPSEYGYANMGNPDAYSDHISASSADEMTSGDIEILNLNTIDGGTVIQSGVAYVILSHGSNGFGAFNTQGTTNTAPTQFGESENTDNDHTFVQRMPTDDYDDILFYQSKWQIDD